MSYTSQTLKKLFALSGNVCAFPICSAPIVDTDSGVVVGDICHIKGRSEGGPRYDPNQTDEERNGYENLILMCVAHNRIVDGKKTREQYPVERLQEFKQNHEAQYRESVVDEEAGDELVEHFAVAGSVITTYNQSGGQNANTIHNTYTYRPGVEREADEDERAWALYADFYKASQEGLVLMPEIGSETHRLAERLVAKGMLERLPPGMSYAVPGQQFVVGIDPKTNIHPTRPSDLRCELAYHLEKVDNIAGLDFYVLSLTVTNDGNTTVRDLRASVAIPREHMEDGSSHTAEVDSPGSADRLFKYPVSGSHREPQKISVDSGESRFLFQIPFTARKRHYLEGTQERILVRVFIIHGHDEARWRELEKMMRDFGLTPIVLQEQPDHGSPTVIEKFERYAKQCSCAFAIFTADDQIKKGGRVYLQARPNTIFEVGWFYAYLGHEKVILLLQEGTEILSDLSGILQKRFKSSVSERSKEIQADLKDMNII